MQQYSGPEECLDATLSLLNEARSTSVKRERAEFLLTARRTIAQCLKIKPEGADVNYVAGLVMYYSFSLNEKYGEASEKYFLKAVKFNPQHQFARMYLGHYYYDVEAYKKALSYFETVDEDYFISIDQRWRVLKLHELIMCCKIFLDSSDVTIKSFDNLTQEYLHTPGEDVPIPSELIIALVKTKKNPIWSRVERESIRKLIIETIEKLSFSDALKEYINDL
jgi:tetratricopeptide (TPR) repeat protein